MTNPATEDIFDDFVREPNSLLGFGATGSVYRARQRSVDRWVALKVIDRRPRDPKVQEIFHERLRREANALARLKHPNIVGIYATGIKDGVPFAAMEYVEGGTLDDAIEQRMKDGQNFTDVEIARVGIEAASALHAAKKQGIVHRDLKPTNLLRDREGRIIVTDFGMAKFLDDNGEARKLTASGDVIGTPEFMAPEQVFPTEGRKVDEKTDVYALGAVLYNMAALRPVFTGCSPYDVMHKHLNAPPPRFRDMHPEHTAELEALILRCLAKAPEDRPDYPEITRELQGVLDRAQAPCVSVPVQAATTNRRRIAWTAVLLGAGCALSLLAASSLGSRRPKDEQPPVEHARRDHEEKPAPASRQDLEKKQEPGKAPDQRKPAESDSKDREVTVANKDEARKDEPPPRRSALDMLANYDPTPPERDFMDKLLSLFDGDASELKERRYDAIRDQLARLEPDARSPFASLHLTAALSMLDAARATVDARIRQIRASKDPITIAQRDGTVLTGTVSTHDDRSFTISATGGQAARVEFQQLAVVDFVRGGIHPKSALALRALSGDAASVLADTLRLASEDEEFACWPPILLRLARQEAAERMRSEQLRDAAAVLQLAVDAEASVLKLARCLERETSPVRRELTAIGLLEKGALSEILATYHDTPSGPIAARRLLAAFRSEVTEDLLEGMRAPMEWTIRPDPGSEPERIKYWQLPRTDGLNLVVLRDWNGLRSLVRTHDAPTAPQGLLLEYRFNPGADADAARFRASLEGPTKGTLYLTCEKDMIALRQPLGQEPDKIIAKGTLPAAKPGAWQTIALIPRDGHLFVFVPDGSCAFHVALTDAQTPRRFEIGVERGELVMKHLYVKPESSKK